MEINKELGPFKLKITIEGIDAEMEQRIIRKIGNPQTEYLGILCGRSWHSSLYSGNNIMNYLMRFISWYEYIKRRTRKYTIK